MYLADSEQTPSALGVGVFVADSGAVTAAGGFLVQMLPGASEESIAAVERNIAALPSPTELVCQGRSADDICAAIMDGLDPISFAGSSPRYACKCSKARVQRTVALIPGLEVYDLLAKHDGIEALCEFCGRVWYLDRQEIETLFRERQLELTDDEDGGN